jgi:hypothetical protein
MNVLTTAQLLDLAEVVKYAQTCAHVIRLVDDEAVHGTARSVCDERGGHLTGDIRDGYLRVTLMNGVTDVFWPVAELAAQVRAGEFVQSR